MLVYYVSAVVKEKLVEDKFNAVSARQAWYLFCEKYSFKHYDYKILAIKDIA